MEPAGQSGSPQSFPLLDLVDAWSNTSSLGRTVVSQAGNGLIVNQIPVDPVSLRVAIVGSGPSGFYAADALFKSGYAMTVDMFERPSGKKCVI